MKPLKNPLETVTSLFRSPPKEIGLAPGTLIHVGKQKMEHPSIAFIDYDEENFATEDDATLERCLALKTTDSVSWINLDGIHDIPTLDAFGKAFDLHPLALEDILNTGHRPKIEDFDSYLLVIVKMLDFEENSNQISAEQVSLVLTRNNVLSFQEKSGDVFNGVRERLKRKSGRIRQRGPDYLTYALLDSIVDSYFHTLEKIGDRLEALEEELIRQPTQDTLQRVHQLKGQLIFLRKSVWPLREVVNSLLHDEYALIHESTQVFLRDLYDHSVQIIDTVETFRDTATGLVDLYMSSISHRMNEVMQVLTIMASLFIPLTFIAGIYGMNFENMPELKHPWGYPAVWLLMLLCTGGMLTYFKRKKWF
ncbi:MAG: magnesium and cobalt transport protein CorA [Desulfuromonas sp.]|nr:MAG: magnesium and cobalt transport protein CorA [Desulfuromonas sp.]